MPSAAAVERSAIRRLSLWSHHRLDLSVESHVLKPEYQDLFTDADRQQARDRLTAYGWTDNANIT